jgi:creatinine amidohydrolase
MLFGEDQQMWRNLTATAMLVVGLAAGPALQAAELVELEAMTWPEVKAALAAGKTTALIYTGGTEQRGPQNTIGGHNLMGRAFSKAIAERLGNAIALPVLPFSPTGVSPEHPGSIGIGPDLMGLVLEKISEDAIANGFKNVVLMGDSGGGQPDTYAAVAKKLDDKYGAKGVHVYYADEIYRKANPEFQKILTDAGYPAGTHGGITDTSVMMYLDPGNAWVRRDQLVNSEGDPVLPPGAKRDPNARRINNGIQGDARRSSVEIGKRRFEYKVDAAVAQIQRFIPPAKK